MAHFEIRNLNFSYPESGCPTLRDVSLTVEEPIPEEEVQQEQQPETMRAGTVVLIVLCVTMAAGLITQGFILTRKLHKLEEERL